MFALAEVFTNMLAVLNAADSNESPRTLEKRIRPADCPRVPGGTAPKFKDGAPAIATAKTTTAAALDAHHVFTRGYTTSNPTSDDVTTLRSFVQHLRDDDSSEYKAMRKDVNLATGEVLNDEPSACATFIKARKQVRRLLKAHNLSLSEPGVAVAVAPKAMPTVGTMSAPRAKGHEPAARRSSISSASETAASDVPNVKRRPVARSSLVSNSEHDTSDTSSTAKIPKGILKAPRASTKETPVQEQTTTSSSSVQGLFSGAFTAMSAPVTKVLQFVSPVRTRDPPTGRTKFFKHQSESEDEANVEEEEHSVELAAALAPDEAPQPLAQRTHSPTPAPVTVTASVPSSTAASSPVSISAPAPTNASPATPGADLRLVSTSTPSTVPNAGAHDALAFDVPATEELEDRDDDEPPIDEDILNVVDANTLRSLMERFLEELNHDLTPKVPMANQSQSGKGRSNKRATAFISLSRRLVRHILDITSAASTRSVEQLLGAVVCSDLRLSRGESTKRAFKLFLENTVAGFTLREGLTPLIGEPGPKTNTEVEAAWMRFLTLGESSCEEILARSTATYPLGGAPNAKDLKDSFERVAENITTDLIKSSTLLGLQGMFVLTAMQHDGPPFEGDCTRAFVTSGAKDFLLYRSGMTLPIFKTAFATHVQAIGDGAHSARTLLQLGYEPPPRLYGATTPTHTFRVDPTAFMTSEADILRRIAALGGKSAFGQHQGKIPVVIPEVSGVNMSDDIDVDVVLPRPSVDDEELASTAPVRHHFVVPDEFVRPGESQEEAAKRVMRVSFPTDAAGQIVRSIWIPLPDGHKVPAPLDYTKVSAFTKHDIKSWLNKNLQGMYRSTAIEFNSDSIEANGLKTLKKGNQVPIVSALDQFWSKELTILWWGPEYPMPRDNLQQLQNGKGLLDSCHTAEIAVMVAHMQRDTGPILVDKIPIPPSQLAKIPTFQGKAAAHIKILTSPINWPDDGTRLSRQYNGSCRAQLDNGLVLAVDFVSVRKADILKDVPKAADDLDKKMAKDAKDAKKLTGAGETKDTKKHASVLDVDKELSAAAAASTSSSDLQTRATPADVDRIWNANNFSQAQDKKKRAKKVSSNMKPISLAEARVAAEHAHAQRKLLLSVPGEVADNYVELSDDDEVGNETSDDDDDRSLVPVRAHAQSVLAPLRRRSIPSPPVPVIAPPAPSTPPAVQSSPPAPAVASPGSVNSPAPASAHNSNGKARAIITPHESSPPLADEDDSEGDYQAPPSPAPASAHNGNGKARAIITPHESSPPLADEDDSEGDYEIPPSPSPSSKTRQSANMSASMGPTARTSSPPVMSDDDQEDLQVSDRDQDEPMSIEQPDGDAANRLTALDQPDSEHEDGSPPPPSPPPPLPPQKRFSTGGGATTIEPHAASVSMTERTASPPIPFDDSDVDDDNAFHRNKGKAKRAGAGGKTAKSNTGRKRKRKEVEDSGTLGDQQAAKKPRIQRSASPTKVREVREALNRVGLTQLGEQGVGKGVFNIKTGHGMIQIPRAVADALGMSQEDVSRAITTAAKKAYPKSGDPATLLDTKSQAYKSLRPIIEQWDPAITPLGILADIVGLVMPDVAYIGTI
ncbi:hypothetical protein BKA62DRAFT_671563 [Auriculariales sp. MPI-PUGE-AT-0066]|nr:hypothetical protein BKA62DRAFT_671563 [Auriculariales sp. MPI-PUGE-AT-0066]